MNSYFCPNCGEPLDEVWKFDDLRKQTVMFPSWSLEEFLYCSDCDEGYGYDYLEESG